MLVLTRKVHEVIRIGDAIRLVIMEFKGQSVRLGIEAPKDIKVWRMEIYERLERQGGSEPQ